MNSNITNINKYKLNKNIKNKFKYTLEEKKLIVNNFIYKNIKYLNSDIIIEEFESDYSDDEIIDIENELEYLE
jgi:hypothetical protein